MSDLPVSLFHYTTIENLCLILKNKSLRFTRLDRVNDPDEAITEKFPNAQKFVYVSCWTSDQNESLPLWKMYSNDMSGVRIRLPINMFKGRNSPSKLTTDYPIITVNQNIIVERRNFNCSSQLIGPVEMEYKLNPSNLNDCYIENADGSVSFSFLHVGETKRDCWSFENEWRFKVIGMPFERHRKLIKEDLDPFLDFPINEYVDISLDESVFSDLVVQLGPRVSFAQSKIVELILKEYAPKSRLCDSSISIRK